MPWVRFDDQFPIHRRIAGLSDAAFRLHVAAICWCARNLTDGYVAAVDVEHVGKSRRPWRQIDELVGLGIWHIEADGWQIHDYLEYQPSKTQVLAERQAKALRQARWRAKHAGQGSRRVTNASQDASVDATPPRPAPKKAGPGRPRGDTAPPKQATAAVSHDGCRRCDGYGWIEQPNGTEARCTSPIFEAGSA